jgi:hypothetical protein
MGRRGERERRCESVVKDLLERTHTKCDYQKNGKKVIGEFLNRLAGGSPVLEEDREYQVCAAVAARTKGMRRKKRARSPITDLRRSSRISGVGLESDSESDSDDADVITPHPLGIRTSTPSRISFSADIEIRTSPRLNLASAIRNEAPTTNSTTATTVKKSFLNGVDECSKKYRKSYQNLSMRERSRRVAKLAQVVLGACIDRTALELSYSSGEEENYLEGNEELAVDLITVLDAIRHRVQREMKINLVNGRIANEMSPPPPSSHESRELSAEDILENETASAEMVYNTSIALLTATTMSGYANVHAKLFRNPNLHQSGPKLLPSYYMLTKNRPKIEELSLTDNNINNNYLHLDSAEDAMSYYNLLPLDDSISVDMQVVTMMSQLASPTARINPPSETGASEEIETQPFMGAKLVGSFLDYVNRMREKHTKARDCPITEDTKIVVLDSYDGAEHSTTSGKRVNVISFNSQLFCRETIQSGATTAGSFNILTWQQVRGEEKCSVIFPVLDNIFKEKTDLMKRYPHVSIYEMHDGKMLYILTQHCLFNCKHHPFLLCKCKRGEGITNPDHECVWLTHEEQCHNYKYSLRKWNRVLSKLKEGETYTRTKHMKWCDEHNLGVSHFGLPPEIFCRSNIRFDIFHLRGSISRRLMMYLRKFIMMQSEELMTSFSTILEEIWREYLVDIWNLNKPLTSFKGADILVFIKNIPRMVEFLRTNFELTTVMEKFCEGMELWVRLSEFMNIVKIDDDALYVALLTQFESNLKQFYECGRISFLTKNADGDDEFFYSHVLRFYLPKIAREIYTDQGVGLGVFTMQGYERRNKESKNTLKRFTNNKGNVLIQNMKRLWDIFYHSINSY